tara:strand:- start:859 stop:1104 length:246 start_codon:yes stop_codon:yes gene_type:complete
MLSKNEVLNYLNSNRAEVLSHEMKFKLVQEYINERTGKIFNPNSIDLGQLEHCFQFAAKWYMDEYHIFICRNKEGIILIFY